MEFVQRLDTELLVRKTGTDRLAVTSLRPSPLLELFSKLGYTCKQLELKAQDGGLGPTVAGGLWTRRGEVNVK